MTDVELVFIKTTNKHFQYIGYKKKDYDTGSNNKINGNLKERTKRTDFIVFEIDQRWLSRKRVAKITYI